MAFTNFKWFKHLIRLSQRFQRNKKCERVNEENTKLIFHFQLFIYFVECSLQAVGYGLRGAGCGIRVRSRSITQQSVRKIFLCQ